MARMAWVLAGGLLMAGAPAQAGSWIAQGVPGATCSTDTRTTASWEYRGQRLLNTDTDIWGIAVATCPVSVLAPGLQATEYRIIPNDPDRRETWCKVYASNGTLVRTHYVDEGSTGSIGGSLAYPLSWSVGMTEMTVHCLLRNGASLDRIELIWWKP